MELVVSVVVIGKEIKLFVIVLLELKVAVLFIDHEPLPWGKNCTWNVSALENDGNKFENSVKNINENCCKWTGRLKMQRFFNSQKINEAVR